MAIYRTISMSFWTDNKIVDDFTPEDRYFYLYLFTNPHTNLCGCYEVSVKQMAYETGYGADSIVTLLKRFEDIHHVLRYSEATKEVFLLNWHKYNWTKSDKFRKPLMKEIEAVKSESFKKILKKMAETDEEYRIDTNCMDTTVTVTVTDTVTNTNANKDKYEEDFSKFWSIYPKKKDKQNAMKAFKKITVPVDELIAAVEKQKKWESWTRDDGRYIPYPTTWLNGKRWEDESGEFRIDDPESYEEVDPW